MSKEKTVMQRLIELGMQKEDFATHSSDLYVRKTPISEKFVKEGYEFPQNVTTFRSDDPKDAKAVFFEIPFAYQEYFQKRLSDGNSKKKERTYDEVVNLLIERGYSPYIASNPSDGISRNQGSTVFHLTSGILRVGGKAKEYMHLNDIYDYILKKVPNIAK